VIDPNVFLTDNEPNNIVVNTYTYNPFGQDLTSEIAETIDNNFKFTGQWYDSEIDQYYLRARMYDPVIMRFSDIDPVKGKLQKPITLHKYLYCGNNPINHVDLDGRFFSFATILVANVMESHLRKMDYKFHMNVFDKFSDNIDAFSMMNLMRGAAMDMLIADFDGSLKSSLVDGATEGIGLFSENLGRLASVGVELYRDRGVLHNILENESWSGLFDYGKDELQDIILDPDTWLDMM